MLGKKCEKYVSTTIKKLNLKSIDTLGHTCLREVSWSSHPIVNEGKVGEGFEHSTAQYITICGPGQ